VSKSESERVSLGERKGRLGGWRELESLVGEGSVGVVCDWESGKRCAGEDARGMAEWDQNDPCKRLFARKAMTAQLLRELLSDLEFGESL
jgi:hypothetical protein